MAKKQATYNEIIASLKRKEYKPIYLLMGEEPYYIDKIADYIDQNVLTPDEEIFDKTIVYAKKDTKMAEIIAAAKRFPMTAQYQVLIIKEAQNIDKKEYDQLLFYLKQPQPSTILVICYKYEKLDARKKYVSEIAEKGVLFDSKKIYDNQVASWIEDYCREQKLKIEPKAANMLSEFLGTDLERIIGEVNKLRIVIAKSGQDMITPDIVERNIGVSKDYNAFELVKALGDHDILKSNRIANYFGKNTKSNPLIMINMVLFGFFSKLLLYHSLKDKSQMNVATELKINPYFVRDYQQAARYYNSSKTLQIISDIRTTDARCKGFGNTSTGDDELLKELVFKILH